MNRAKSPVSDSKVSAECVNRCKADIAPAPVHARLVRDGESEDNVARASRTARGATRSPCCDSYRPRCSPNGWRLSSITRCQHPLHTSPVPRETAFFGPLVEASVPRHAHVLHGGPIRAVVPCVAADVDGTFASGRAVVNASWVLLEVTADQAVHCSRLGRASHGRRTPVRAAGTSSVTRPAPSSGRGRPRHHRSATPTRPSPRRGCRRCGSRRDSPPVSSRSW